MAFFVLAVALGASAAARADTVVKSIKVGEYPQSVAITPDGQHVYVVNHKGGTVSVIATAKNAAHTPNTVVGRPIKVGGQPVSIAITPDGRYAYVANSSDDTVSVIALGVHSPGGAAH